MIYLLFINNIQTAVADNRYGVEYGTYTSDGWLNGQPFTGPMAMATFFSSPTGQPCTDSRYFGVS